MSLSGLKVGDKIARVEGEDIDIVEILRITPTGIIRIEYLDEIESFDKFGKSKQKRDIFCGGDDPFVRVATDKELLEHDQQLFIDHTINSINRFYSSRMTFEQAVKINEVLGIKQVQ